MLRLDINLVFTIINILVLYFLMNKFLFKRVNGIIEQREEMIKKQFADAKETQLQADALKQEYEESLTKAKQDASKIIMDAKEKANTEYGKIVKSADEEAQKRLQKAEEQIAEEKKKTLHNMEAEIGELVMAAATKVVGGAVSVQDSQKLYDEFLLEMGEKK